MTGDNMKSEPWVTMEEIAGHLGVSQDTVHRWIRLRKMPAHKVGHLWKFQISEVDEWVRTGRANGVKSTGSTGKRVGHGE